MKKGGKMFKLVISLGLLGIMSACSSSGTASTTGTGDFAAVGSCTRDADCAATANIGMCFKNDASSECIYWAETTIESSSGLEATQYCGNISSASYFLPSIAQLKALQAKKLLASNQSPQATYWAIDLATKTHSTYDFSSNKTESGPREALVRCFTTF